VNENPKLLAQDFNHQCGRSTMFLREDKCCLGGVRISGYPEVVEGILASPGVLLIRFNFKIVLGFLWVLNCILK